MNSIMSGETRLQFQDVSVRPFKKWAMAAAASWMRAKVPAGVERKTRPAAEYTLIDAGAFVRVALEWSEGERLARRRGRETDLDRIAG